MERHLQRLTVADRGTTNAAKPLAPWLSRRWLRAVYAAVLCIWMVAPFVATRDVAAQDVVPFIAAANISDHNPDAVYPGPRDGIRAPQALEAASCPAYDDVDQC